MSGRDGTGPGYESLRLLANDLLQIIAPATGGNRLDAGLPGTLSLTNGTVEARARRPRSDDPGSRVDAGGLAESLRCLPSHPDVICNLIGGADGLAERTPGPRVDSGRGSTRRRGGDEQGAGLGAMVTGTSTTGSDSQAWPAAIPMGAPTPSATTRSSPAGDARDPSPGRARDLEGSDDQRVPGQHGNLLAEERSAPRAGRAAPRHCQSTAGHHARERHMQQLHGSGGRGGERRRIAIVGQGYGEAQLRAHARTTRETPHGSAPPPGARAAIIRRLVYRRAQDASRNPYPEPAWGHLKVSVHFYTR
jgi:hypothetical protein